MFDVSAPSQFVAVNTTAATLVAGGEAYLERIVVGASAATTANVYVKNTSTASTNTTTGRIHHFRNGDKAGGFTVEYGCICPTGISLHCTAKVKLTVVYKYRAR